MLFRETHRENPADLSLEDLTAFVGTTKGDGLKGEAHWLLGKSLNLKSNDTVDTEHTI